MKKLPPALCKSLFLISLGFLGYELQPTLFPRAETVEVIPEVEPLKPASPILVAKPQEKKEEPKVVEKVVKPTPKPIAKKAQPLPAPEPKVEPKKRVSPLESASLILVGNNATSRPELEKDAQLLEHASYHGEWDKYRAMLGRSLAAECAKVRLASGPRRYENLWDEPKLYSALLRWEAIGKFPPATLNLTKSLAGSSAMMQWLMTNDEALEEVILTVHKNDHKDKAFRFLAKVWANEKIKIGSEVYNDFEGQQQEQLCAKYFNLALATALVFDSPVSYKNPTSDGSHVDGYFRYHWYLKKNEKGLLEGDIHRASAKDLTFVVCGPISTSELEWALKKYRSTRRKNIGKAFSDVEYLMERAVEGLDPYAEYTLPEILKEGGICGDQTYFCVNTARAAGIPAFGLSGMTNSGPHAWAAVKVEDDEWSTKIGRIAGVSKGSGRNPQTGEAVIEQRVWMWSEREHASRSHVVKVFRNLWLANLYAAVENIDEQNQAIYLAHQLGLAFPELWKKAYEVMLTDEELTATPALPKTLDTWKNFVKKLKHQFRENPRMSELATVIEDKQIFPYSKLEDVRRDLARLRRRNTKNAAEQADLQTTSLRRETELILARDEEDALTEVHQLYSRALRDYGGSISGFDEMAQYYFSIMKRDEEVAKKAVRTIESAFDRVVSTGSSDWFRIKAEVGIHKKIAAMYREVGEEKRAISIDKKLARIMKNAKRKAL